MCHTEIFIAVASFAFLAQVAVTKGANTTLPLTYPGQVLQVAGNQTCPSEEQEEIVRNEIDNVTLSILRQSLTHILQHYSCGGSTGWRRVAYLNMSDPFQQCPSVWQEITTPHRVCGRNSTAGSCEGINYTTGSEQYDQVCGRIIGYQISTPNAFGGSGVIGAPQSIDGYYVDGVSITHGSPRQHLWTFAGGLDEVNSQPGFPNLSCPCVNGSTADIPSFVGQNYFCETGITRWNGSYLFWPKGDPLWDGQGCGPTSSCCTFNSPPWFNVQLSTPTADDIEVRICGDQEIGNEDTPVQLVELYVK